MTVDEAAAFLSGRPTSDDLLAFGRVMVAAGELDDPDNLLHYFEKPWKWAPEYAAWANLGRPTEDDPEWDRFYDALNELMRR